MDNQGSGRVPPAQRGPKRPAPTIDLTATEVASGPIQPAADPPPEASASAGAPPETPRADEPKPGSPPPPDEPPPQRPAIAWLPPDFPWPLAAAGAAGVALTLIVLALTGVFSSRDSGPSPADARLARLEQQVRDLAARPAPVSTDPKTIEDLSGRVSRLETSVATPRPQPIDPALANRLALIEGEIKSLGERVGVVARRNDEVASIAAEARKRAEAAAAALAELPKTQQTDASASRAEADALTNRIASLEKTVKALQSELGERASANASDPGLRALAIAGALTSAIDRGAPFAVELAAAKAVAADAKALAALDPFAKSGVPSVDSLARELAALLPALAKAAGSTAREGGFLDRLRSNAEKIVRVRPLDETAGDDPAAVIQRLEARAAERNLTGAVAEIAKLPAPARDLAKDWVAKVETRNAALEASRRFMASALAAIGKPTL
jgi:hypothetical protein